MLPQNSASVFQADRCQRRTHHEYFLTEATNPICQRFGETVFSQNQRSSMQLRICWHTCTARSRNDSQGESLSPLRCSGFCNDVVCTAANGRLIRNGDRFGGSCVQSIPHDSGCKANGRFRDSGTNGDSSELCRFDRIPVLIRDRCGLLIYERP